MKVLIYSNRHNAWWKKYYAGYGMIEDAGIYELNDVLSHYAYLDFDKSKDNYLVKLEDAVDEFEKRKHDLYNRIDSEMDSIIEKMKACYHRRKMLEEGIANIVSALNQIEKDALK